MPRPRNPDAYGNPAEIAESTQHAYARDDQRSGGRAVSPLHQASPKLPEQADLMTLAEFAVLVRRSPRTVRAWIRDGVVPTVRIGRAKFIHRDILDDRLYGANSAIYECDKSILNSYTEQLKALPNNSDTLIGGYIPELPLPTAFERR